MRKSLLVAQREYFENIRTKGFWIGTLLMPFLFGASMIVPSWLEATRDAKTFAVVDESGWLAEAAAARIFRDDLAQILETALSDRSEAFPAQVRELAQTYAQANESERPNLIEQICTENPQPADVTLAAQAEALKTWWRELNPKEAARLVPLSSLRRFVRVDLGTDQNLLTAKVRDGELFAFFVISADPEQENRYVSANLTDTNLKDWYTPLLGRELRERRMTKTQVSPEIADWIARPIEITDRFVSKKGESEAGAAEAVSQWIPVAFVYLLWMSVFSVSMMMLTSTVLEKSNRLVEVLLSSISPIQLMSGKILGSAATGLTTVGTWLLAFLALVHFLPALLGVPLDFSLSAIASDPAYLISFVVYFTLGYLFYGAVLVGLGSVCDNLKDAQNMASPVSMTLFLPLMLMIPVGQDPNGTLARICSYFPPLTPFVMMNRAAGPPTTAEYLTTTLLMIVSVAVALWAAAKVFRIGILMSGKPPKLRELWRWIITSA